MLWTEGLRFWRNSYSAGSSVHSLTDLRAVLCDIYCESFGYG